MLSSKFIIWLLKLTLLLEVPINNRLLVLYRIIAWSTLSRHIKTLVLVMVGPAGCYLSLSFRQDNIKTIVGLTDE